MSDYEPGTVAVATVRSVEGVRVVRVPRRDELVWMQITERYAWHESADVTDVRPLVVLDLPQPGELGITPYGTVMCLRQAAKAIGAKHLDDIADQIEAQTRPPKPDEPTGLGAVVKDRNDDRWVRAGNDWTPGKDPWRGVDGEHIGWWSKYADIDVVEILSDGVQP